MTRVFGPSKSACILLAPYSRPFVHKTGTHKGPVWESRRKEAENSGGMCFPLQGRRHAELLNADVST